MRLIENMLAFRGNGLLYLNVLMTKMKNLIFYLNL